MKELDSADNPSLMLVNPGSSFCDGDHKNAGIALSGNCEGNPERKLLANRLADNLELCFVSTPTPSRAGDLIEGLVKRTGLITTMLAMGACLTFAQRGGKAEPNRIEFKRGAISATVNGVVRGSEEAEYVFAARKGQRITVRITSTPLKSSVFQILGPDNDTLGLEFDANFQYAGVAPKTGDYFLSVKRPTEAKGSSKFKLTVTIK